MILKLYHLKQWITRPSRSFYKKKKNSIHLETYTFFRFVSFGAWNYFWLSITRNYFFFSVLLSRHDWIETFQVIISSFHITFILRRLIIQFHIQIPSVCVHAGISKSPWTWFCYSFSLIAYFQLIFLKNFNQYFFFLSRHNTSANRSLSLTHKRKLHTDRESALIFHWPLVLSSFFFREISFCFVNSCFFPILYQFSLCLRLTHR